MHILSLLGSERQSQTSSPIQRADPEDRRARAELGGPEVSISQDSPISPEVAGTATALELNRFLNVLSHPLVSLIRNPELEVYEFQV